MPKVKIIAPGFEGYNGIIEGVVFENGVSTEPLSQFAAERVGAFLRVVDADTEEPLGLGYRMANARGQGVAPREPLQKIVRTKTGKEKAKVKPAPVVEYSFTKEELEKVADEGGIQGLRKVADQYSVRGRSIKEIIDSLMALKANQEAKKAAETPRQRDEAETAGDQAEASDDTAGDVSDIDSLIEG